MQYPGPGGVCWLKVKAQLSCPCVERADRLNPLLFVLTPAIFEGKEAEGAIDCPHRSTPVPSAPQAVILSAIPEDARACSSAELRKPRAPDIDRICQTKSGAHGIICLTSCGRTPCREVTCLTGGFGVCTVRYIATAREVATCHACLRRLQPRTSF